MIQRINLWLERMFWGAGSSEAESDVASGGVTMSAKDGYRIRHVPGRGYLAEYRPLLNWHPISKDGTICTPGQRIADLLPGEHYHRTIEQAGATVNRHSMAQDSKVVWEG